ncbi:hypothetical protein GCM10010232_58410 [Streptomyces amakusaensis]|uniref:Uncharacterized protein n=2 Tax=Streptomyces TaxID=1883 RepID=A0A918QKX1_9ACTN|nr:hypothetical protein [Streptomyces inusitatus]GGZ52961.1 hypothetical protein GCM10010387_53910 [Streptomyces inusitatus]
MDEAEDRRLRAIAPDISHISVSLLRRVVGAYPEERIPEEALRTADEVLENYGTDGLRVLVMSLTGWAAVEIEKDAHMSGRTHEALLDDMDLTRLEVNPDG